MTKKSLTVLLIEDNPEFAKLVQRWLSSPGDIEFVLNWTDSLAAGLNRLARGGLDAILLDLGLRDSNGFETFVTVKAHASGVPVVILSGRETESLALQMVRQGAQDYIIKTTCDRELLVKALRFAILRAGRKVPVEDIPDHGTVMGVMGAKGGVGATTFACNLAIELRRQTNQGTLLADLDVNAGLASFLMHTEVEHSMLDAVAHIHRLDLSLWDGIVAHGPDGVDIVRSPNLLGIDSADLRKIQDVLALVRLFNRWTVLDLGRMTGLSLSLLDKLSELYLVTTLSLPAIHEAKRTASALMKAGLKADRLRLIVNQVGTAEELSGSELDRLFGFPVYGKLPDAAQELGDACIKRELPAGNSHYRVRVASLARKIAGLSEGAAAGAGANWRPLANKFRSTNKNLAAATRA